MPNKCPYIVTTGLTGRQREIDRLQRALSQAGSEEARAVGRELDGYNTIFDNDKVFVFLLLILSIR